jgi:hypothetical protein
MPSRPVTRRQSATLEDPRAKAVTSAPIAARRPRVTSTWFRAAVAFRARAYATEVGVLVTEIHVCPTRSAAAPAHPNAIRTSLVRFPISPSYRRPGKRGAYFSVLSTRRKTSLDDDTVVVGLGGENILRDLNYNDCSRPRRFPAQRRLTSLPAAFGDFLLSLSRRRPSRALSRSSLITFASRAWIAANATPFASVG